MSIESRIAAAKELIRKREEIDQQLAELFAGGTPKKQKCSICGSTEHTARTCPQKSRDGVEVASPRTRSPLRRSRPCRAIRRTTKELTGLTRSRHHRLIASGAGDPNQQHHRSRHRPLVSHATN